MRLVIGCYSSVTELQEGDSCFCFHIIYAICDSKRSMDERNLSSSHRIFFKYGLSEYGLDKSKLNKFKKLKSWLVFYSLPSSTEYDPGRTHKIYCSVRSYKIKRVNKNPMPSFFPSKLNRRPKSRYRFSLGNIPRLLVPRLSTLS